MIFIYKVLAKIVADLCIFFGFSEEGMIDPDAAMQVME